MTIRATVVSLGRRLLARTSSAAPAAMAQVGTTLFFTPRRFERPERERQTLARARPFALRHAGGELAAWQWGQGGQGRRTTLLVHGWQGRGAQLAAFADPLVSAGHRVITFDAPAHGDSPGHQATIASFRDAILSARDQLGPLDAVIAHSMGAAATVLAMRNGLALSALGLIAPPASPRPVLDRIADLLALDQEGRRQLDEAVERRVGVPVRAVELTRPPWPGAVSVVVAHDRQDRVVPWDDGARIAEAWPAARLLSTDGLGHARILRDGATVQAVTCFVDRKAAPLSLRLPSSRQHPRPHALGGGQRPPARPAGTSPCAGQPASPPEISRA